MATRGRFVWEELITPDPRSAAAFYSSIAGIKTEPAPGDPSYTLLVSAGGRMGGMMALGPAAKIASTSPGWLSYIDMPNVDETARQADLLGGRIVKSPTAMGDGGRYAVLQDPQGAMFAVYTSPRPYQPSATAPLGGASWHELVASDMNAVFPFYQQLFGWHVVNDMDMGATGKYRLFAPEGSDEMLGGMYTKTPQQPGPLWLPYIKVANVATATTAAKKGGAQIMHGPADVPGGKITIGVDPQGATFAVHEVTGTAPSPKPRSRPKAKAGAKKKSKPAKTKRAPKKRKAAPKKKAARKAGSKK